MTTYRFRLQADDFPVDPGDWLPEDEEHYNRVGPFQGCKLHGWTCEDQEHYENLTAEEWFTRPDSDVSNWCSYVLILERTCDMGHWHAVTSLGGLDYVGYPYKVPPSEGVYETAEQLAAEDPYLADVAGELLGEEVDA
jgi:hypothetical protein